MNWRFWGREGERRDYGESKVNLVLEDRDLSFGEKGIGVGGMDIAFDSEGCERYELNVTDRGFVLMGIVEGLPTFKGVLPPERIGGIQRVIQSGKFGELVIRNKVEGYEHLPGVVPRGVLGYLGLEGYVFMMNRSKDGREYLLGGCTCEELNKQLSR